MRDERAPVVLLTFDIEMDVPPYMSSWRGVDEGLPAIIELLESYGIRATFFTIGMLAVRKPWALKAIVDGGHELGSHGFSHKRLDMISFREAVEEVFHSLKVLREYQDILSFRAPYLKLPPSLLPALKRGGVSVDSSIGRYKPPFKFIKPFLENGILRVPVSYPSSVLRLPWRVLKTLYKPGDDYVILLHPWEVTGIRCGVRPDLTAGVGPRVLENLGKLIEYLRSSGYHFKTMREYWSSELSHIGGLQ